MKGIDGLTPVLKAVISKDIKTLKVLLKHSKTDIYIEVCFYIIFLYHIIARILEHIIC